MPLVTIKGIEGVFTDEQKAEVIRKVTDAMVSVEGETCVPSPGSSSKRLRAETGVLLANL